jgi:hypothetical protein
MKSFAMALVALLTLTAIPMKSHAAADKLQLQLALEQLDAAEQQVMAAQSSVRSARSAIIAVLQAPEQNWVCGLTYGLKTYPGAGDSKENAKNSAMESCAADGVALNVCKIMRDSDKMTICYTK